MDKMIRLDEGEIKEAIVDYIESSMNKRVKTNTIIGGGAKYPMINIIELVDDHYYADVFLED